jgi:hypothetical protein
MITVLVQFRLQGPVTPEKARELFAASAPKFRGVPGLVRKYYLLSDDGRTAGGVYLWKSRAEAEALYTPEWKNSIEQRYGSQPTITYFESPVIVDNLSGQIL